MKRFILNILLLFGGLRVLFSGVLFYDTCSHFRGNVSTLCLHLLSVPLLWPNSVQVRRLFVVVVVVILQKLFKRSIHTETTSLSFS